MASPAVGHLLGVFFLPVEHFFSRRGSSGMAFASASSGSGRALFKPAHLCLFLPFSVAAPLIAAEPQRAIVAVRRTPLDSLK